MTSLSALHYVSEYSPQHRWVMAIDGLPLDQWLAERQPSQHTYKGLAPALGNLTDSTEARVAWERILPLPGCRAIAPLLICPEHLDFSCLVVMAEVFHQSESVIWERLGINLASAASADDLGSCVEWFSIEPQTFSKEAYLACLEPFQLIRLNQHLQLEGKNLEVLLASNPTYSWLSGHLCLGEQGLYLNANGIPIQLAASWLSRIQNQAPTAWQAQSKKDPNHQPADFYLLLSLSELNALLEQVGDERCRQEANLE